MIINLRNEHNKPLSYNPNNFYQFQQDLDEILAFLDTNHIRYAKKAMFSSEIKSNNLIEGLRDDLSYIEEVIKTKQFEPRIMNLYHGYKYILKNNDINKDSLKELYDILSANLLEEDDLKNMGPYYRNKDVYVHTSTIATKEGEIKPDPKKVPYLMDQLLEYINIESNDSIIDNYIKSQIIHFYFVYIHPYFDVNGRTSRTLSMWYLLNNKAYSFIIFNRGINYNKNKYYDVIENVIKYSNIDKFIKYMLQNVKEELIKEVAIKDISSSLSLSIYEIQTINYLLSMKNNLTVKDFFTFYNHFNDKMPINELRANLLEPLANKELITFNDYSKNNPYNQQFCINKELIPNYLKFKKNN